MNDLKISKIYTIQRQHDILSISRKHQYFIGFKTPNLARKVQYSIHPEPELTLVRNENIHKDEVYFDNSAILFIPKCIGSTLEPMNDGGFHMNKMNENEFYLLLSKRYGIIIPYDLVAEDQDEFIFKSFVFDPIPTLKM